MVTAIILCVIGLSGVVLLYMSFARGLKFADDRAEVKREQSEE